MSYADGMAALNLEFSGRVPRTEYSAESHWALVQKVTGRKVDQHSTAQEQHQASLDFMKAWNYDFCWSVLTHNQIFGDRYTRMGHAVYASGGVDFDSQISQAFSSVDEIFRLDMDQVL